MLEHRPPAPSIISGAVQFRIAAELFVGFLYAAIVGIILSFFLATQTSRLLFNAAVVLAIVVFLASDWASRFRVSREAPEEFTPAPLAGKLFIEVSTVYVLALWATFLVEDMAGQVASQPRPGAEISVATAFATFAALSWVWDVVAIWAIKPKLPHLASGLLHGNVDELDEVKPYLKGPSSWVDRWKKEADDRFRQEKNGHVARVSSKQDSWTFIDVLKDGLKGELKVLRDRLLVLWPSSLRASAIAAFHFIAAHVLLFNLAAAVAIFAKVRAGIHPWPIVTSDVFSQSAFVLAVFGSLAIASSLLFLLGWRIPGSALIVVVVVWLYFQLDVGMIIGTLAIQQVVVGSFFQFYFRAPQTGPASSPQSLRSSPALQ